MLFKALKGWTVIFKKLNEYACWLLFLPERDDALLMRSTAFSVVSRVCLIEFDPEGLPALREQKSPTPMERIHGWISNTFSAAHIVLKWEIDSTKFCEVWLKKLRCTSCGCWKTAGNLLYTVKWRWFNLQGSTYFSLSLQSDSSLIPDIYFEKTLQVLAPTCSTVISAVLMWQHIHDYSIICQNRSTGWMVSRGEVKLK